MNNRSEELNVPHCMVFRSAFVKMLKNQQIFGILKIPNIFMRLPIMRKFMGG